LAQLSIVSGSSWDGGSDHATTEQRDVFTLASRSAIRSHCQGFDASFADRIEALPSYPIKDGKDY